MAQLMAGFDGMFGGNRGSSKSATAKMISVGVATSILAGSAYMMGRYATPLVPAGIFIIGSGIVGAASTMALFPSRNEEESE